MADTKITDLTSAVAASGDEIPANRAGADRKLRAEEIAGIGFPASATDNAVARFDGTSGKLIQNSAVTIDDSGNFISSIGNLLGLTIMFTGSNIISGTNNADSFGIGGWDVDGASVKPFVTVTSSTVPTCSLDDVSIACVAGTATVPPLRLKSGTSLTTSTAGAIEYDGTCFYATAQTSARQVIDTEQFITQSSAFTGTTVNTAQKLFDASTGLSGALTVGPNRTYFFETGFSISSRSTLSNTHSFGFTGSAAVDRQWWVSVAANAAASSVPTATVIARCTATNAITAASSVAQLTAFIQGKVVIGTSGTLIPSITRSAGTVALVTDADSYFRIWPVGSTSVTRVGHWS